MRTMMLLSECNASFTHATDATVFIVARSTVGRGYHDHCGRCAFVELQSHGLVCRRVPGARTLEWSVHEPR
jgi:hypothetical protein